MTLVLRGTSNFTPAETIRSIESDRKVFRWKVTPSLKENERKRSLFKGLAASAALTFNTPGVSIAEVRSANQRMLNALSEIQPETAISTAPRSFPQVLTAEQVSRTGRFLKEATDRALDTERLEWLKARERLDRLIPKLIPAIRYAKQLDTVYDLAFQAGHEANLVNGFCHE